MERRTQCRGLSRGRRLQTESHDRVNGGRRTGARAGHSMRADVRQQRHLRRLLRRSELAVTSDEQGGAHRPLARLPGSDGRYSTSLSRSPPPRTSETKRTPAARRVGGLGRPEEAHISPPISTASFANATGSDGHQGSLGYPATSSDGECEPDCYRAWGALRSAGHRVCTGVCSARAIAASVAHLTRSTKPVRIAERVQMGGAGLEPAATCV